MKQAMTTISSPGLPRPLGAYSQAVGWGDLVMLSGQIAINRDDQILSDQDVGTQVDCIFENVQAILAAAGSSLDHILDVTAFLTDLRDFGPFNERYSKHLGKHRPARSVVQVGALPKGVKVELKIVAYRD